MWGPSVTWLHDSHERSTNSSSQGSQYSRELDWGTFKAWNRYFSPQNSFWSLLPKFTEIITVWFSLSIAVPQLKSSNNIDLFKTSATLEWMHFLKLQEPTIWEAVTTDSKFGPIGRSGLSWTCGRSTQPRRVWPRFIASFCDLCQFCGRMHCCIMQPARLSRCLSLSSSRTWVSLWKTQTFGGSTVYVPNEDTKTPQYQVKPREVYVLLNTACWILYSVDFVSYGVLILIIYLVADLIFIIYVLRFSAHFCRCFLQGPSILERCLGDSQTQTQNWLPSPGALW